MKKLLLIGALVGLMVAGAPAEDYNLAGTGSTKTIKLTGQDTVNISGSANHITLEGNGDSLNLMGSSNEVTVRAKIDSVDVMGSSNTITIDGEVDSVNLVGSVNKVVLIVRPGRAKPSVNRVGANNNISEQNAK